MHKTRPPKLKQPLPSANVNDNTNDGCILSHVLLSWGHIITDGAVMPDITHSEDRIIRSVVLIKACVSIISSHIRENTAH